MIPLRIRVLLHQTVMEDCTVQVRDNVRLGESADAAVSFPGADLVIVRRGDRLLFRGREIFPGAPLSMFLGGVTLELEALDSIALDTAEIRGLQLPSFDVRVLVATAALALMGAFVDTVTRFVETDPTATEQVAVLLAPALLESFEEPTVNARFTAPGHLPQAVLPDQLIEYTSLPEHDFDLDEEPLEDAPTVRYQD